MEVGLWVCPRRWGYGCTLGGGTMGGGGAMGVP